ncbi:Taste Receptor Type 1 Member 2 [Manis pentadactyla]|nr:Taste Receptor Type 1 Member 2 [Manis pentadactyla]
MPSTRPGCPSLETTCKWECGTFQDTTASFNTVLTLSGERLVYNVYLAVSVVAYIAAQPPGLQAGQLLQGGGLCLADEFDCQPCSSYKGSHRNDTSCFKQRLPFQSIHHHCAMLATLGFLSTLATLVTIPSCSPSHCKELLFNPSLDLLLFMVGFSFACMCEELPTNHEAKFTTCCMTLYFTSSIFLCTFTSVYGGVLVTMLNPLGISLGYSGPKCYMILFYLKRYSPVYFNSMTQGYGMRRRGLPSAAPRDAGPQC